MICVSGNISNSYLLTEVVLFLIVDMKVCYNASNAEQNQLLIIDKSYCFSRTSRGFMEFYSFWVKAVYYTDILTKHNLKLSQRDIYVNLHIYKAAVLY